MCVTITVGAAKYMRRMVRFGEGSASAGFRLSVRPGGCSGFDSSFTIQEAPARGDTVIEQNGARVFLSPESCALLDGYTIDFRESALEGSLSYSRPGQGHSCGGGCGTGGTAVATVTLTRPGARKA